jgi:hypothetical protein
VVGFWRSGDLPTCSWKDDELELVARATEIKRDRARREEMLERFVEIRTRFGVPESDVSRTKGKHGLSANAAVA